MADGALAKGVGFETEFRYGNRANPPLRRVQVEYRIEYFYNSQYLNLSSCCYLNSSLINISSFTYH